VSSAAAAAVKRGTVVPVPGLLSVKGDFAHVLERYMCSCCACSHISFKSTLAAEHNERPVLKLREVVPVLGLAVSLHLQQA
jgi:hypothetical protein